MASFRTMPWQHYLKGLAAQLLNFVFPPTCVTCKKVGSLLCPACAADIEWLDAPVCACCGQPAVGEPALCGSCRERPLPLAQVRSATQFTDPIAAMVHGLKYKNQFALAQPLAGFMVGAWPLWQMPVTLVCPIPLHPRREKKRGYNQAALLARLFARQVQIPYQEDVLQRTRNTQSQVHLDAAARKQNVAAAFDAPAPGVRRQTVLLIDDVYTTGATMAAAADALLAAGATAVYGYSLARAV